jgi:polysaccharide biosynthesis protein VpsQ
MMQEPAVRQDRERRIGWSAVALVGCALGFGAFLAAIIVMADMHRLGFLYSVYDFPYGDKAGHFVLFGTLSFLADAALFKLLPRREPRRMALITSMVIALLVSLEEASQAWMPSRTLDAVDLLASYAGIATGGLVACCSSRNCGGARAPEAALRRAGLRRLPCRWRR